MRTITVIGSINVDLVVTAERLPDEGETVLGSQFQVCPGGKGANQAVAAAALGAKVSMVGCVGNDDYGRLARDNLARRGVATRFVRKVRDHTGVALIMVDHRGRNLIAVAPGANRQVNSRRRFDIAVTQLETPYTRPNARFVILNPAPAADVSLEGVDVVIPNESEAERLTGHRDPERAAQALVRRGAKHAIITLGERGVYDGAYHLAPRAEVVDTVGAGDAFVGAYAAAIAEGHADPVRFAQTAAALKCTRPGAQNVPSREEVERHLQ